MLFRPPYMQLKWLRLFKWLGDEECIVHNASSLGNKRCALSKNLCDLQAVFIKDNLLKQVGQLRTVQREVFMKRHQLECRQEKSRDTAYQSDTLKSVIMRGVIHVLGFIKERAAAAAMAAVDLSLSASC